MSKKKQEKRYFVNEEIRADKIMLLDEEGNKIWILSKQEALQKAAEEEKDVIQVGFNPKDGVAIAKLMEYWKFIYKLKKEEKEKKKHQKVKWLKEIKFWYNIWENDLKLKLDKIKEFLQEGYNVKVIGELRGREMLFKQKMYEKIKAIEEQFKDIARSQGVKQEKRGYSVILFTKVK